jgi:hypothetical protein
VFNARDVRNGCAKVVPSNARRHRIIRNAQTTLARGVLRNVKGAIVESVRLASWSVRMFQDGRMEDVKGDSVRVVWEAAGGSANNVEGVRTFSGGINFFVSLDTKIFDDI